MALLMLLVACSPKLENLNIRLHKADRIEVEYFGVGNQPSSKLVLSGVEDIDKLSSMVTDTAFAAQDCPFEGKITFTKADSVIFVGQFSLQAACRNVAFTEGAQSQNRKLSAASMAYLAALKASHQDSKLDALRWFLGKWTQVEGPELVSFEEWALVSPTLYQGRSWTEYQGQVIHDETIDLLLEGDDIFYIPTVPENAGPVRFKMKSLEDHLVIFENPAHDYPQIISYEAKGDTALLAKISGAKGGKELVKEFPLRRVK